MNLTCATYQIVGLMTKLAPFLEAKSEINAIQSPSDRIVEILLRTRHGDPNRRCYFRDTIIWER
jgi:hypothetical protein